MSSVNVLPDMDEPRLKALGKQLNRNRKSSLINSGMAKQNLDVYVKSLNKEKRSLNGKYNNRGIRLKKTLAHVRGTQKVLRSRREQTFWEDTDEHPYGMYEGASLNSYRRQIDNIIEQKHPKYRRQKKVETQLRNGRCRGRILDDDEVKEQFDEIMKHGSRRKQCIKRENPLSQTFLSYAITNSPAVDQSSPTSSHRSPTLDHLWKDPNFRHRYRMKHQTEESTPIDQELFSPIDLKMKTPISKEQAGFHRIYSPKTCPELFDIDSPGEIRKCKKGKNAGRRTTFSIENLDDDHEYDADDERNQDAMTSKSMSTSKLSLPAIKVTKNSVKSHVTERSRLPDLAIRRVTKVASEHYTRTKGTQCAS